MNKFVCLIIASLGVFSGCRTHHAATQLPFQELNGEWNVVEMNGTSVAASESAPYLVFDTQSKRLSGNAGCNRIMGAVEYAKEGSDRISFPQIATTRMACPDMSGERELLQTLEHVERFGAAEGDAIALFNEEGERILLLKKK